jgi:guanylate kinase
MGKSGVGKDTIVNELCAKYGLTRIVSYTTRPRRGIEDTHYFVDDYLDWCNEHPNDHIVAYSEFAKHEYWVTQRMVDAKDLYIVDLKGLDWLRKCYTGHKYIKVIYLTAPWYQRFFNMLGRGDGPVKAAKRLVYDARAFAGADREADSVVPNNTVEQCVSAVWEYISTNEERSIVI